MDAVKSVYSPSVKGPTSTGGSGTNCHVDTAHCTHCVKTVKIADASLPAVRYTTLCRSPKMLGRSTSGAILWHSATAATYSDTDNFFFIIFRRFRYTRFSQLVATGAQLRIRQAAVTKSYIGPFFAHPLLGGPPCGGVFLPSPAVADIRISSLPHLGFPQVAVSHNSFQFPLIWHVSSLCNSKLPRIPNRFGLTLWGITPDPIKTS